MIYLDNSSTTRKKPFCVLNAVLKATWHSANPTRSSHTPSLNAALKVYNTREHLKSFFNAPKSANVVFTYNCTEAINTVIFGTAKKGGNVVITAFEHNATFRPLNKLIKTHNITITIVNPNSLGEITSDDILNKINDKTYLVIVNQTSNVTGSTVKLNNLGHKLKQKNIMLMVDTAQSAGHEKIDMQSIGANFLCVAGHKGLFATQGIGALILNDANVEPLKFGGSGSNSLLTTMPEYYPEKLEAGTINTIGISALDAGVGYVEKHLDKINNKKKKLSNILINYLKQNKNITLYSSNPHSGVISFKFNNLDNNEVCNTLNEKYKICVRPGLHCAPLIHKFLKTEKTGLIRVSISYFNNFCEIKKLVKALNKIEKNHN